MNFTSVVDFLTEILATTLENEDTLAEKVGFQENTSTNPEERIEDGKS